MTLLIGVAFALTLAVMPTLAWAQVKFPARYPWVISVSTSGTTPSGQGHRPPLVSIEAAVAVPNFISYRDRSRTASSESDHAAQEDAEPTGIFGDDKDVQP
jgi:hypothetical protein